MQKNIVMAEGLPSPLEGEGGAQRRVRGYKPSTSKNAKNLRKRQTDEETKLWHELRNRRFSAFKFRRQQPVGSYIADFFCAEAKLIIEDDGLHHDVDFDRKRNDFLRQAGYRIIRFANSDINYNSDFVLENIWIALHDLSFDPDNNPSPAPMGHPLPQGERERFSA